MLKVERCPVRQQLLLATSARTPWSWRSSAPGCASGRIYPSVHQGHLPAPHRSRPWPRPGDRRTSAPSHGRSGRLAEVLADVLACEQVPLDSNFFEDLGADSHGHGAVLRAGAQAAGPAAVSIKDVYQHPTIAALATARRRRKRRIARCGAAGWPRCWPTCWTLNGSRSTATSSRTWARTRWSWRSSARGCANARTCPGVHKDVYEHPDYPGPGSGPRRHRAGHVSRWPPLPEAPARRVRTVQYVTCARAAGADLPGYASSPARCGPGL